MSLSFLLALAFVQQSTPYPRAELLIEPKDLIANVAKYRVLDVRPQTQFEKGHLRWAVWVDHDAWAKTFAKHQDLKAWSKIIGDLGIDNQTEVAIYDDGSTKDAARVWWVMRYFNHTKVRIVHAGWHGLMQADVAATTKVGVIQPQTFAIASPAQARLADKASVLDILNNRTGVQIIDTRSEKEYCGETKLAKRGGAIPGAIHLEWTDAIDPKTKRFKSAGELTKLFKDTGIDLKKKSVTHCQSGGRAAVMAFALEMMGSDGVSNYYRSWSEWGNDPSTPIVLPKKK